VVLIPSFCSKQVPEVGSYFRDNWNSEKKNIVPTFEVYKGDQFLYGFSLILNFAQEKVCFSVIIILVSF
jgi:hypothetical protein